MTRIFTARKRSLRRLCFYRCVSVHSGGGFSIGGVLHRGGVSIRGGSPSWGGLHPGGVSIRSMCGRYASYWNAFLSYSKSCNTQIRPYADTDPSVDKIPCADLLDPHVLKPPMTWTRCELYTMVIVQCQNGYLLLT